MEDLNLVSDTSLEVSLCMSWAGSFEKYFLEIGGMNSAVTGQGQLK